MAFLGIPNKILQKAKNWLVFQKIGCIFGCGNELSGRSVKC
jgi:hypothetical protein